VAGLAAVETAFFRQDHPIIEAERVDHRGAHAARSGLPNDDHAVAAEQYEMGGEVPEETRRLYFLITMSLGPGAIMETISLPSMPSWTEPLASSPRVLFHRQLPASNCPDVARR
jgi:hypothetical protein